MFENTDQTNRQPHRDYPGRDSRTITDKMMKILTGRLITTERTEKIIAIAKTEVAKNSDIQNVLWDTPNATYDKSTFRKVKNIVAKVAIRYLRYLAKKNTLLNDAEINITKLSLEEFLNLRN